MGGQGRDDERAHDHRSLHERVERMPEVQHGPELHIFRRAEVRLPTYTLRDSNERTDKVDRCAGNYG